MKLKSSKGIGWIKKNKINVVKNRPEIAEIAKSSSERPDELFKDFMNDSWRVWIGHCIIQIICFKIHSKIYRIQLYITAACVRIWSVEEEDNLRSIATNEWRSVLSTGIYRQISHVKRASEPRFLYGGKLGGKPDL
jgi:hypothetical protein